MPFFQRVNTDPVFMHSIQMERSKKTNSKYQNKKNAKALIYMALKSQCHPKCFARQGTFFTNEKYAIFLIVVKSDLHLLPSLPLAIRKH